MKELTEKERIFIEEYLIDLNATRAAKAAGYSEHTARQIGYENLTKPHIEAALQEKMRERSERTQITADYVLGSLKEVAERCMQRAPVMIRKGRSSTQLIDEEGRHVWRFDSAGANKSFELLGKHLGLFSKDDAGAPDKDIPKLDLSPDDLISIIDQARGAKKE